MKLRIHTCRFLLVSFFWSSFCFTHAQVVDDTVQEEEEIPASTTIQVEDYLESLCNAELEQICLERGVAMNTMEESGHHLTRQDYLEAARQCLSLDDDINAILAQNPELAAELEVEIERMKQEKERLQRERQEMLQELDLLQEQLRQAGVDIADHHHAAAEAAQQQQEEQAEDLDYAPYSKNPANMTFPEVFQESLVLLAKRVHQDIKFVMSIVRPILRPILGALRLAWKYAKPILWDAVRWIPERIQRALHGENDENASDLAAATTGGFAAEEGQ